MHKTLRCPAHLLNKNLEGKVFVVTGANSGVGLTATQQLATQGAHVVMGCRRVEAGQKAAQALGETRGSWDVLPLDLASLKSVRAFAAAFCAQYTQLDGLLNNAGIMGGAFEKTQDGFEAQIGTNHFGHFLLTELLLETLKATPKARIVAVSSCFHVKAQGRIGEIDVDDLHFERRAYDPMKAYAQSKLANVIHMAELARRLEGADVTTYSVHPGWVRTNLAARMMPLWIQNILLLPLAPILDLIDAQDGAQSSLYCLLADDIEKHSGGYFSQKGLYPKRSDNKGGWPMRSPNPQAHDTDIARKLYALSFESVGLAAR